MDPLEHELELIHNAMTRVSTLRSGAEDALLVLGSIAQRREKAITEKKAKAKARGRVTAMPQTHDSLGADDTKAA